MLSKKVFLASDAFVSLIDRAHPKHVHATAYFRYFALNHFQLYTSIIAVNDAYMQLYNTISPSIAKDFLRAIELSSINMLYLEESDIKLALRTFTTSNSIELTLAKSIMAVVCHKRSVPQICTFESLHTLFGLQTFYLPI
jgi:predicted nucleic acid-binding protein